MQIQISVRSISFWFYKRFYRNFPCKNYHKLELTIFMAIDLAYGNPELLEV